MHVHTRPSRKASYVCVLYVPIITFFFPFAKLGTCPQWLQVMGPATFGHPSAAQSLNFEHATVFLCFFGWKILNGLICLFLEANRRPIIVIPNFCISLVSQRFESMASSTLISRELPSGSPYYIPSYNFVLYYGYAFDKLRRTEHFILLSCRYKDGVKSRKCNLNQYLLSYTAVWS